MPNFFGKKVYFETVVKAIFWIGVESRVFFNMILVIYSLRICRKHILCGY